MKFTNIIKNLKKIKGAKKPNNFCLYNIMLEFAEARQRQLLKSFNERSDKYIN